MEDAHITIDNPTISGSGEPFRISLKIEHEDLENIGDRFGHEVCLALREGLKESEQTAALGAIAEALQNVADALLIVGEKNN